MEARGNHIGCNPQFIRFSTSRGHRLVCPGVAYIRMRAARVIRFNKGKERRF